MPKQGQDRKRTCCAANRISVLVVQNQGVRSSWRHSAGEGRLPDQDGNSVGRKGFRDRNELQRHINPRVSKRRDIRSIEEQNARCLEGQAGISTGLATRWPLRMPASQAGFGASHKEKT